MTVDQYFAREVFYIIDTVVHSLAQDPNRKFIYVETGFFARWWEQADDSKRSLATTLVKSKQLEFINGGWCMHDEASPLWTASEPTPVPTLGLLPPSLRSPFTPLPSSAV